MLSRGQNSIITLNEQKEKRVHGGGSGVAAGAVHPWSSGSWCMSS